MNNATLDKQKNQNRDPFWDSLKFLLMFFVVFGHTLQYSYGEEYFLKDRLFMFIYTFHMPLFIFITGFFSKNITPKKFLNSLPSLAVTYIVFQTILSIANWSSGSFNPFFLFHPTGVMWYLACLIIWRLIFAYIPKKKSLATFIIILSFILSFSGGFFLSGNMATRVVSFLPYFVLGFYCPANWIDKIRKLNKVAAIVFLILMFGLLYKFAPKAFIYTLYGDVLYSNLVVTDNLFSVTTIGAAFRIISYVLAAGISCAVIALTPSSFARWGDKTLYLYLLHAVFIAYVYYNVLNYFEIKSYISMHLFVSIALIALIVVLSNFKLVKCIVDPVNNFFRKKRS